MTTAAITSTTSRRARRTFDDIGARIAGLGGIAFAAIVVVQNILRGGSAPSNGASAEEVLLHYADDRAMTVVLVATFVLGGSALAVFLAGTLRRLLAGGRPGWAIVGGVGGLGVMALFAIVVGAEQALSVVAAGERPDLGAVQALWAFHNSAFSVLHLFLALAVVGLARAGVAAGLTPRVFDTLAPVAAVLLLVGAVAGPYIAVGEAMALFGLALLGFATWLAFLVSTGLRLVRSAA